MRTTLHLDIDGHDGHRIGMYAYNGHNQTKHPKFDLTISGDFTAWCFTCGRRIFSREVVKTIIDADGERIAEPQERKDR